MEIFKITKKIIYSWSMNIYLSIKDNIINKKNKLPVEFIGYNWTEDSKRPIALLFGFSPWKRAVVSAYLKDYKTAFVLGNASLKRIKKDFIENLPNEQEVQIFIWGSKFKKEYKIKKLFTREKRIDIIINRIEDGFLRSIGAGLLHTRPASLCVDSNSIYFDANKESELEHILQNYDFHSNPDLTNRARFCIELIKKARLTKYYNPRPYSDINKFKKSDNYSILVIGQVEGDASLLSGKAKIKTNHDLIKSAHKDHPNADIYYRPHPDYWSGNRKEKHNLKGISDICAIVPPDISLYEMFDLVDHVYTITSLSGFEALIHGLKVTTLGVPFYSNWGLTEDKVILTRRNRKVSLEELVAAVYLLYPKYLHPNSDENVSFESVASYFIVESLKEKNIFKLEEDYLFNNVNCFSDRLSKPFKVLSYLSSTGNFAEAKSANVTEIIGEKIDLNDYPQISHLLSKTSNYDQLVEYSNASLEHLSNNVDYFYKNTKLIDSFFYSLSLALKNTNGRVIKNIPNINVWIFKLTTSDNNLNKLISNYIKCLSYNLQYDIIEDFCENLIQISKNNEPVKFTIHNNMADFIEQSFKLKPTAGHFRTLTQILTQKPSRSERYPERRHQITNTAAACYLEKIDEKYCTPKDAILNRSLYWYLLDDAEQSEKEFQKLTYHFTKNENNSNEEFSLYLKTRFSDFLAIGNYFIKNRKLPSAKAIVDSVQNEENVQVLALRLNYLKTSGNKRELFSMIDKLAKEKNIDNKLLSICARSLRESGFFEQSKIIYKKIASNSTTLAKKISIELEIDKINFCNETSSILNSAPQPRMPKGVIFLASQTCFNTLAMMTPSLVELKNKGYAVVNLTEGMTEHQPTGIDYIDQFAGIIPLDLVYNTQNYNWKVDWDKKTVEAKGINFYQGFYERISTYIRRFHVDINMPAANKSFRDNLRRADSCLFVCNNIFENVVKKGMPVAFVSGNSHVTPFSVFRDFARHKDHPLLSFINCNVAYEAYFSNLGSKFANTMCVTDMTLHKNIRAPFMARQDQFDIWYDSNKNNPVYIDKSESLIKINRVGSTSNVKELEIISFIEEKKKEGKKIICAFGKVPVDLNVPYDGGPAHTDMADWITNTVEICNKSNDIILLVKPHPHELRPEIALDLVGSFHDLINVPVSKNIILLDHKDINGHALAPYLDLALLYNGSSGVELTAQGIPVMMTSYFGRHDYPVNLLYPDSRQQYENFILQCDYPAPSDNLRHRAAFLLCYLGTEEISILNQYSLRQLTNDKIGVPQWRDELINDFLINGDPKMKLIADRIVEKFEKELKPEITNIPIQTSITSKKSLSVV